MEVGTLPLLGGVHLVLYCKFCWWGLVEEIQNGVGEAGLSQSSCLVFDQREEGLGQYLYAFERREGTRTHFQIMTVVIRRAFCSEIV